MTLHSETTVVRAHLHEGTLGRGNVATRKLGRPNFPTASPSHDDRLNERGGGAVGADQVESGRKRFGFECERRMFTRLYEVVHEHGHTPAERIEDLDGDVLRPIHFESKGGS